MVGLAILAGNALTILPALHPCAVAVTVILDTPGLLAGALPLWYECRDTLESARVSEVGNLSGFVDLQFCSHLVAAAGTLAAVSTDPPFGEALAVHFEAVNFGALAAS